MINTFTLTYFKYILLTLLSSCMGSFFKCKILTVLYCYLFMLLNICSTTTQNTCCCKCHFSVKWEAQNWFIPIISQNMDKLKQNYLHGKKRCGLCEQTFWCFSTAGSSHLWSHSFFTDMSDSQGIDTRDNLSNYHQSHQVLRSYWSCVRRLYWDTWSAEALQRPFVRGQSFK